MDSVKVIGWIGFIFFMGLLFSTTQMTEWITELSGWITIIKEDFFDDMPPSLMFGYSSIIIIMIIYFVNSFRK